MSDTPPTSDERWFALPVGFASPPGPWTMRQSDWSMESSPPRNATYSNGVIRHTDRTRDIGSAAQPVLVTLDPHWKFIRFEFFDRYYGAAPLSGGGPHHARRISIPPVGLEGFRDRPEADRTIAESHSNWTIGPDSNNRLQCLPWIVQRNQNGSALPALAGNRMGLRFRSEPDSYIYSRSDTVREIVDVPSSPPDERLDPSAERLRYYRLPTIWKSRLYYTRTAVSPPAGDFFQNLTAAQISAADTSSTPLVFSLDDIVLTDAALAPISLGGHDRVAIFHHRFASGPQLSNEGLYRAGNAVETDGYPYSDITVREPVGGSRCYISDYPDWTRLVVTQANLFDTFDERTPDQPNRVVGARAAVRRVDATVAPNGTTPGNVLRRPPLRSAPYFHVQPFFQQEFVTFKHNPQPGPLKHIEWTQPLPSYTAASPPPAGVEDRSTIGRFDISCIRCCDHDGGVEVSSVFLYHRAAIRWAGAPPALASAAARRDWVRRFVTNVMARWNSPDPACATCNEARAIIVPTPNSPPNPQIRSQIVLFLQYLVEARAHFRIGVVPANSGSWMAGGDGTGELRINAIDHDGADRGLASAHEYGHCSSLPDDYRPGMDRSRNYRWNAVPGNPYVPDENSLMNYNWFIRARYLWFCAQWLRTTPGLQNVELQLQHGNEHGTASGFRLPHYPHATASARNWVHWPVSFNIRDGVNFDSFLYLLGADLFSTDRLPRFMRVAAGSPPGPGIPGPMVDGILMVLLRAWIDMSGVPGINANRYNEMYDRIIPRISWLNFRRYTSFQLFAGAGSEPRLSRCLIHFLPCFLSSQEPFDTVWEPAAAATRASTPEHLTIRISTAIPAVAWNAGATPTTLDLDCPANFNALAAAAQNAEMDRWADSIVEAIILTLGFAFNSNPAVANSFAAPASYERFVRAVQDAGAPNPNLF